MAKPSSQTTIKNIDYFISYTHSDRDVAEWIARVLEEAGFKVLIQFKDIRASADFIVQMNSAVQRSNRILAVVSPAYFKSTYCQSEFNAGFVQDPDGSKGFLLPVMVEFTEFPPLFKSRVYVDLVGLDKKTARNKLLQEIVPGEADQTLESGINGLTPLRSGVLRYPDGWNVPVHPSSFFIGHDHHFTALSTALNRNCSESMFPQVQVFVGNGGVGKTMLAAEYARRKIDCYDAVLWLSATPSKSLRKDLDEVYEKIASTSVVSRKRRITKKPSSGARLTAVRNWLDGHDRWLVIADGINKSSDQKVLFSLFNGSPKGHLLATSRRDNWPPHANRIYVGKSNEIDSLNYLRERLNERPGAYIEESACEIAKELGGLVLALEQAVDYIKQRRIDTDEYLKRWRVQAEVLMNHPLQSTGSAACNQTVATTWALSVAELSAPAKAVLALIGWLAPPPIPRRLFVEQAAHILKVADAKELQGPAAAIPTSRRGSRESLVESALMELTNWSLITLDPQWVECHRLLQATQRWRYGPVWLGKAAAWVNAYLMADYSSDDVRSWPRWRPMEQHLAAILEYLENQRDSSEDADVVANLLSSFGRFLMANGKYLDASPYFRRALRLRQAHKGERHPDVASSLLDIAILSFNHKLYDNAEDEVRRAILMYKAAGPSRQDDLAVASKVLAEVLKCKALDAELDDSSDSSAKMQRIAIAEAHARDARSHCQKAFGQNSVATADCCNILGELLRCKGEYTKARTQFIFARTVYNKELGENHPTLATVLNNMALCDVEDGRPKNAVLLYYHALEIMKNQLGPTHPHTKTIENNIAYFNSLNDRHC